jgi:hypothetical protein
MPMGKWHTARTWLTRISEDKLDDAAGLSAKVSSVDERPTDDECPTDWDRDVTRHGCARTKSEVMSHDHQTSPTFNGRGHLCLFPDSMFVMAHPPRGEQFRGAAGARNSRGRRLDAQGLEREMPTVKF